MIFPAGKSIKIKYSDIKPGDLVEVKTPDITSLDTSSPNICLAFILSTPKGDAGKFIFESNSGGGVVLFENDHSCNIYYDALVGKRLCKVFLKDFSWEFLEKLKKN